MGRSNNSKQILLGSKGFSLPSNRKGFNYNIKNTVVPNYVDDYQLGATVYWPTSKEDLASAFGYSTSLSGKKIIKDLAQDIEQHKSFLNWVDEMAFFNETFLSFAGEEMFQIPKNNQPAFYAATVLDFRIIDSPDILSGFGEDIKEILFSSQPLKDSLFKIEQLYNKDYMVSSISNFAKPLPGQPLKIGLINQGAA